MARSLDLEALSVTIASGASLSSAIGLGAKSFVGIAMPATWTAASITFQVSYDGSTFLNLFDANGTEIMIASASAAASQAAMVDRNLLRGAALIKVRSGTAAVPVNQGADRVLGVLVRSDPQ